MSEPEQLPAHNGTMDWLEKMIEATPDAPEPILGTCRAARNISFRTHVPLRYRDEWPRPMLDPLWVENFGKVMAVCESGGIIALVGRRGTGKTRIAAEAMRNFCPDTGCYSTAMGLFLRIRSSYDKKSGSGRESEADIAKELIRAPLLILDEVQERANSAWEDRVLTHILDARYGAMRPTVLIANLTEDELIQSVGESICSRIEETGGIIEFTGPSHRAKSA